MVKKRIHERGLTLLEALVAMVVLSIGILTLYSMASKSITGNAGAQDMTVASTAIGDRIEQLSELAYDNGSLAVTTGTPEKITTGLPKPLSEISWTVSEWRNDGLDNDGDTKIDEYDERGIKSISVTATYSSFGRKKTHTVNFLKAEVFK